MTNVELVSSDSLRELYLAYLRVLNQVCVSSGISPSAVIPSKRGLYAALREVQLDIDALHKRRSFTHGISKGKIAGILVFRLTRIPVLMLTVEVADNPAALKLQVNAAVLLGLEFVSANHTQWPTFLIRELKYFVSKRHSNQECLGICFDIFANSQPKPQTRGSLPTPLS